MPGTKNLEHRLGGLEKQDVTGNVSYDGENHQEMIRLRAAKIQKIADFRESQWNDQWWEKGDQGCWKHGNYEKKEPGTFAIRSKLYTQESRRGKGMARCPFTKFDVSGCWVGNWHLDCKTEKAIKGKTFP